MKPIPKSLARQLKWSLTRDLYEACSEWLNLEIYDGLAALREDLAPLRGAPDSEGQSLRELHRKSIGELRGLLRENARERELQEKLVRSDLLQLVSPLASEVTMPRYKDHRGMRMDLVLGGHGDGPSRIIELKRGSHRLIAYRGSPQRRLSSDMRSAIDQLRDYGNRVAQDNSTVRQISEQRQVCLAEARLWLVAGRRLHLGEDHQPLLDECRGDPPVVYFTWDGFLTLLETIAT